MQRLKKFATYLFNLAVGVINVTLLITVMLSNNLNDASNVC